MMFWALKILLRNTLSLSISQVALVELGLPNTIAPLSAKENFKSNWLHPSRVNTPSDIFSLKPPFGNCNLNFPRKNLAFWLTSKNPINLMSSVPF